MPNSCKNEVEFNTVILNGVAIPITKNPTYKKGNPKTKSQTSFVGSTPVVTKKQDFTEAQGSVKISVRHTKASMEAIEYAEDKDCNSILIIDRITGRTLTFTQMSIEEDVEWDMDADETEVEFKGGQGK